MKNKRIIYILFSIALVLLGMFSAYFVYKKALVALTVLLNDHQEKYEELSLQINGNKKYEYDYSFLKKPSLIAHGLGKTEDNDYQTNTLEAFENSYKSGYKLFEADLTYTDDNYLVCVHGAGTWHSFVGDNDMPFTYENFKKNKILNKYTPIDYKDLIDLLIKYDDIYLITDTKYTDAENYVCQFQLIINYALEKDASVLERIIPQFYTKEMLFDVMSLYDFKSVIFTLYQYNDGEAWDAKDVGSFCVKHGVKCVTCWESMAEEEIVRLWNNLGIKVCVHTVDDLKMAEKCFEKGITAIYTDEIEPSMVGEEN